VRFIFAGAILIDNSQLSLTSITFTNNVIQKYDKFPNLRRNVYVQNSSSIAIFGLNVDTERFYFIYVNDENIPGRSTVNDVMAALFVPRVISVSPLELSTGVSTQFVFKGEGFFPCGLSFALYKGGKDNQLVVCSFLFHLFFFFSPVIFFVYLFILFFFSYS
jgi:hypothetical protein